MRIAIIAPPFIPVPPLTYGGTELFVAHLAEALTERGHQVIVYANGQSRVRCEVRWLYRDMRWPPARPGDGALRGLHHAAWAMHDSECAGVDVVHMNDAGAVPLARFLSAPAIQTLHHPYESDLSELYTAHPDVWYVAISDRQRTFEQMPRLRTIHHGLRLSDYRLDDRKQEYLSFRDGVSGWICRDIDELARRAAQPEIEPASCREHVSRCFSLELMAERYERVYQDALAAAPEEVDGAERDRAYAERR